MNRILNQVSGHYIPSFFFSSIDTDEDLGDLSSISNDALATYFHEYIHYLQDTMTYYGLMNIHINVDILKYFNNKIIEEGNEEVQIPIKIPSDTSVGENLDLNSYYYGSEEFIKSFQIVEVERVRDGFLTAAPDLEHIIIKVSEGFKEKDYHFGAFAIKESMAHELEKYFFGNVNSSDAPYSVVNKLVSYYQPKLCTPAFIVSLCDISLNFTNPPCLLIDILERIESGEMEVNKPDDLYNVVNNYSFNILDLYETQNENSEAQLCDYITDPKFNSVKSWIIETHQNAKEIRKNDFRIFLNLMSNNSLDDFISFFFDKLNGPMVSNNQDTFWFHNDKYSNNSNMALLKGISEVMSFLKYGEVECGLLKFCEKNYSRDITDKRCIDSPWQRGQDEQLCILATILKMWGIHDYDYTVRSTN